jgi:glycerol kinase
MPLHVVALDAGTTSTRCVVFDPEASPVASAQREHRQITPEPGWLEHDPAELIDNACTVLAEAVAGREGDIAAVGITNQRETTVVWERATGRPIYNAIVWSDARTADRCDRLKAEGGIDRLRNTTGLPIATYFSATKLAWILDHVPGARNRAGRGELCFGTVDSWLLWHLTGRHVTDSTNASRTQLVNLDTLDWDEALLKAHGIPREVLPTIEPGIGGDFGEIRQGPMKGVPVTGVLGDQHAALFGQCCFNPGQAKNTYGTGCFLLLNTGSERVESKRGLLTTPAWESSDGAVSWALEGSVAVAGSAVQWLRDRIGLIETSEAVEPLANSVQDAGGVIFVPAFNGLFAPHWDASARGTILGLTQQTTAAHLARATLDAACHQSADVFEAMAEEAGLPLEHLAADGGMAVNDRLLQFQADLLGVPVERPAYVESTAVGAAFAAGSAAGVWADESVLTARRVAGRRFEPSFEPAARAALRARWREAVSRAQAWARGP